MTEPRPEEDLDHYRAELDACRTEIARLRALVLSRLDRLHVDDGDAFLVRLSRSMDHEICLGIAEVIHGLFPEAKVLVVDSTVDLTVEEIAELLRRPDEPTS